ncbi:hypothetical protein OROMI_032636 [Orobanche minor]
MTSRTPPPQTSHATITVVYDVRTRAGEGTGCRRLPHMSSSTQAVVVFPTRPPSSSPEGTGCRRLPHSPPDATITINRNDTRQREEEECGGGCLSHRSVSRSRFNSCERP